jgi:hypothetical protein
LPARLVPTWRNGRSGSEAIARRLDHFLISDGFLSSTGFPTSWVELPFFSDHAPILLQLNLPLLHNSFPFKFNHHWLSFADYSALVHSVWTDPCFQREENPQLRIVWKLKVLKAHSKSWSKIKKATEASLLNNLESEITQLILTSTTAALSLEDSVTLKALERSRDSILREEEKCWRLRSRATWLKWGDSNSKFFHKVASFNRNKKLIWSIESECDGPLRGQEAIKAEAVSHFEHLFKASSSHNLLEKCSTASLFPQLVSAAEASDLYKPVTLPELKEILIHFKKERSPGPDGWTAEFFTFFFDLVGSDLLQMVEDSRIKGKISRSLNSTFLVLIPKENNSVSFNDYRPISLCNLIYKVISKVISNRIKPFLERSLSAEQLGFLKGRRIQDAIGAAHESIHSIKQKNLKALVMKIDLKKAFDSIDWEFLRLILHTVGFGDKFTDWILSCVTSANFAVLINGEATSFFKSERGLRQGCPLSPYLFILIMEGLSLLLSKSISEHRISGIKVSNFIKIVHLMFVDDILLMSKADLAEWLVILDLLQLFCSVSGLSINFSKSTVHYWGLSEAELSILKDSIPFSFFDLKEGFRYLGYQLKPGASSSADWSWLVAIFERRIGFWCNKWLSLGGRFILVKSVLESLVVYWMTLERIPNKIIIMLRRLSFNFLWNDHAGKRRFHLCSWQSLSRPRRAGGWGLKNLSIFNTALLASSFWRAVTHDSIWHRVIMDKYLGSLPLLLWLRKTSLLQKRASPFWKGLVSSSPVILHWLRWKPGSGSEIKLGRDKILGMEDHSILSPSLRSQLGSLNFWCLAQMKVATRALPLPDLWFTVVICISLDRLPRNGIHSRLH